MYKHTVALVAMFLIGASQADPKCYTGPVHTDVDTIDLWQCVTAEESDPKWHEWECAKKHFQYWSNGHWGSAADCLGGCAPCLEGAAVMGAEWVKCDQEVQFAHCAVGWSPIGKGFCGVEWGPC